MKLVFKQIEPFVAAPDPAARVILVYGPDQGLMKERSTRMAKTCVADLNDPFNVATLHPEKILADPAIFYDEANAQSLMGGNRLILIKDATDSLSIILKEYLEDSPSPDTLVIVEAGDLGPRSALRKLCEGAKNAAAVPAYVDDERNLSQIIRDMCAHAGYRIDKDALDSFSAAIVGDRAIARNEIEKLLLYKGHAAGYTGPEGPPAQTPMGSITLADIVASCGDVRDWTLDRLIYAVGDGNGADAHRVLQGLIKDQIAMVAVLRSMQNHFWRLFQTQNKIQGGLTQAEAMKSLNPPVFWKVEDAFRRQLSRWSIPAIERALDALNDTEARTKQTGYDDTSLVTDIILQLCRYRPDYNRQAA